MQSLINSVIRNAAPELTIVPTEKVPTEKVPTEKVPVLPAPELPTPVSTFSAPTASVSYALGSEDVVCATFPVNDDKTTSTKRFKKSDAFTFIKGSGKMIKASLSGEGIQTSENANEINSLLMTMHMAFANHYNLTLTPDDFLLQLVVAAASVIRQSLPIRQSKEKLSAYVDDVNSSADWEAAVANICNQIREKAGDDVSNLLITKMTTTGSIQLNSYMVSLMHAVEGMFDYDMYTRCGFPQIKLLGTSDDWKLMRTKALAIADILEIPGYKKELESCLDKIVLTAEGKYNPELKQFWKSMYHYNSMSGGEDRISGWIQLFFPGILDSDKMLDIKIGTLGEIYSKSSNYYKKGRGISSFPLSVAFVTATLNNAPIVLYSGQVGVVQESDMSLRPQWGWAVYE